MGRDVVLPWVAHPAEREFAARWADVVLPWVASAADAVATAGALRAAARRHGRDPAELRVQPVAVLDGAFPDAAAAFRRRDLPVWTVTAADLPALLAAPGLDGLALACPPAVESLAALPALACDGPPGTLAQRYGLAAAMTFGRRIPEGGAA
ncbi:hypothetical protein BJF78_28950 [Pseudonocardia sp. CNS-139]|nr:hypothetical protein BJF78_28950 [Pseudonocardia sp. CNS-139]